MKIVISGASSFIGRNLLSYLMTNNFSSEDKIITIVRKEYLTEHKKQYDLYLDLDEYKKLGALIGPCDVFIHLAWYGTRGEARNNFTEQNLAFKYSIEGIKSLLQAGCKKIILAGSQAEYGIYDKKIDELTPSLPITWYGKKKLELFRECSIECQKYSAVCIEPRFFSLYGIGDYENTLIMSTLRKMLIGDPCNFTLATQKWNYLNITDAVEAIYKLILADNLKGIFNFGSYDTRILKDYILEMKEILNSKSNLFFGAISYPSSGIVTINPDITKLANAIDWSPKISFKDGILSIIKK